MIHWFDRPEGQTTLRQWGRWVMLVASFIPIGMWAGWSFLFGWYEKWDDATFDQYKAFMGAYYYAHLASVFPTKYSLVHTYDHDRDEVYMYRFRLNTRSFRNLALVNQSQAVLIKMKYVGK